MAVAVVALALGAGGTLLAAQSLGVGPFASRAPDAPGPPPRPSRLEQPEADGEPASAPSAPTMSTMASATIPSAGGAPAWAGGAPGVAPATSVVEDDEQPVVPPDEWRPKVVGGKIVWPEWRGEPPEPEPDSRSEPDPPPAPPPPQSDGLPY